MASVQQRFFDRIKEKELAFSIYYKKLSDLYEELIKDEFKKRTSDTGIGHHYEKTENFLEERESFDM